MTAPKSEEDGVLREWAPLSKLLGQIPLTVRKGLFFEDVKFTCVDAVADSIAVGTNVGIVFWYDRTDHRVERLSPEKSGAPITAVKLVSTVDFMIAAGDTNGIVSIFKVPKILPEWLLDQVPCPQERKIEMFTVSNLHISHITCLEWSLNGQKLFSGDSSGRVVFTEIDFLLNLTKAREIINENFTIVQLSYSQHLSALVVATIHRCVICYKQASNWTVVQIGQKERTCLAELGGIFFTNDLGLDPVILSCRPGLRLWQADTNGSVQRTIIFKDSVKKFANEVPLLSAIDVNSISTSNMPELGKLYSMSDGLILSQTKSDVLVLKVSNVCVKARLCLDRVISACATQSEVFVIPSDRDLIRLAFIPDSHDCSLSREGNVATGEAVSFHSSFNISPITGTLLDNNITPGNNRPVSMPCEVMYGHDSALLPPIVPIQEGVAELRLENAQRHVFPAIGHQQFDDIIYRKKPNKNKRWRRSYEVQKTSLSDKLWNSMGGSENSSNRHSIEETLVEMAVEVPSDFLSDLESLDKIIQDARRCSQQEQNSSQFNKENEMTEESVVPVHHENEPQHETHSKVESPKLYSDDNPDKYTEEIDQQPFNFESENCETLENYENQIVPETSSDDSIEKDLWKSRQGPASHFIRPEEMLNLESNDLLNSNVLQIDNNNDISQEQKVDVESSECLVDADNTGESNYMKPSLDTYFEQEEQLESNSAIHVSDSLESVDIDKNSITEGISVATCDSVDRSPQFYTRVSECEELTDYYVIRREMTEETKRKIHPWLNSLTDVGDGWKEVMCPGRCISISANEEEVVICTPDLSAYRLCYDDWEKLPSPAEIIDLAPNLRLVATVNCGVAHYSKRLQDNDWNLLGREVEHLSVDDKGIWFISRNELFFLPANMSTAKKVNTEPYVLTRIYSASDTIAGVVKGGKVVKFIGDVKNNWQLVLNNGEPVKELAFGPGKLVWLLDIYNNLYVADNLTLPPSITSWWQVVIGNGFMVDVGGIYASEDCLYVCDAVRSLMYINRTSVKGHKWEASNIDLNCNQICAESLTEDKGAIWVLTKSNQLFYASPHSQTAKEVVIPGRVVCMSCTPHALWLLSEEGNIYIRQGITNTSPMGTHWSYLNLEQISDKNMQLVHVSCGWDVTWACDIRGHVLMTVSSPHNISDNDMFSPAWVLVDGTPLHNNTFTKVYVGADSQMVWALDSAGNLYVREAIFPEYLLGADWVHVPGIKASHLCISGGAVWALAKEGVYKRVGITQTNYIGESWILIPGLFDHISVSGTNQLWGVNCSDGVLMKHSERMFSVYHEPYSDSLSDWTIV